MLHGRIKVVLGVRWWMVTWGGRSKCLGWYNLLNYTVKPNVFGKTDGTWRVKIMSYRHSNISSGGQRWFVYHGFVGGDLKRGASGCPGLHVAQHGLKSLHVWGVSVGQVVRQATVQTERLQLKPDETKTVLIKQHKEPRGALRTGEAMPSNQACPVEAEMEEQPLVNILIDMSHE